MTGSRTQQLAVFVSLLLAGPLLADVPIPSAEKASSARLDAPALAARIDQLIQAKWRDKNVTTAPLADDAEFLRRAYLDLTGRIPRVAEARDFLADKAPDRRARLVETLLDNPRYVLHLGNTWRAVLLPPNNNQQFQVFQPSFKNWLDGQIRNNVPYDQMARAILTVPVNANLALRGQQFGGNLSPQDFYQNNEFKAENLAAATSRLFLGVRLECAQCHDHPFAKYSRKQFWEYAAFFSNVQPQVQLRRPIVKDGVEPVKVIPGREILIAGTDKKVEARFLDGREPIFLEGVDSRTTLAEWLTSSENPYFARTGANRVWAHFFGIGIIDPIDDEPTDENPISHPELLDVLTQQFVAHNFDMKYLIRAITLSKTYQRTSVSSHVSQNEPRLFARMAAKGMSPDQLFDSLAQATGYQEKLDTNNPRQQFFLAPNSVRGEITQMFTTQDKKTETQTSILQALALMNGKFIADATSLEKSATLAAVADAPFMTTAQRIETLFLMTLTRMPREAESKRLVGYVESGGPRDDRRAALGDVFWALLNSSEFILNH